MSNLPPNIVQASVIPPEFVSGMEELGWKPDADELRRLVLRKTLAHVNEHNSTRIDATVRRVPSETGLRFAIAVEAVKGDRRLRTEFEIASNGLALPFHEYVLVSANQVSIMFLEFPDSVNYYTFERVPDGEAPQSKRRKLELELIRASNDYLWVLSSDGDEDRSDDYCDAIASASNRLEDAALALAGFLTNGGLHDHR